MVHSIATIVVTRGVSGRKILGGQVLNRLGPPGGAKGCHTLQKSPNIGGEAAPLPLPDTLMTLTTFGTWYQTQGPRD